MGRYWMIGMPSSRETPDFAGAAAVSATARQSLIERLAEKNGLTIQQMEGHVKQARGVLKTMGHDRSPSEETGMPAPVMIRGERFETVGVENLSGGDRLHEVVRRIGGGRFETRRIIERVDGGDHTRVVAEVR